MIPVLTAIAVVLLGAAAVAMALRNLIHCALWLVLAWSALAAFYLWAGAEFLAFAQVLIYVGAVSMVVLFAVLLTRRLPDVNPAPPPPPAGGGRILAGVAAGVLVAGVVARAGLTSPLPAAGAAPVLTTRRLGVELMGAHAGALVVAGVILTMVLIGAVVLAAPDSGDAPEGDS